MDGHRSDRQKLSDCKSSNAAEQFAYLLSCLSL